MKKIGSPLIEISGLYRAYKKVIIDSFNISIGRGDRIAVLHKNPLASSLLCEILSGKETPDKGKVFFKGDNVTGHQNNFGVVGKKSSLSKFKSVLYNGSTPLVKRGLSRCVSDVAVQKELSVFGLQDFSSEKLASLPKNLLFRAELFSAYMCSHELVVIDEPFSELNKEEKAKELENLKNISQEKGIALLLFTEDIDTALSLSQTVMVVNSSMASVGMIAVDNGQIEKTIMRIKELIEE